jgi:DNA-binding transcriptional ArsR family regulator
MAKYNASLNHLFTALSHPTRREIIQQTLTSPKTVSEIAAQFDDSLVTISKHLKVLEKANLITRKKVGRTHWIRAQVSSLKEIDDWVSDYRKFWTEALDRLDIFLTTSPTKE